MKIELLLPLKDICVNQPFGVNYLDFYKNLNMKGHNGIDFRARTGCRVNATHGGVVTFAGMDNGGGISVELSLNEKGDGFKTIYYHLKEVKVTRGDKIKEGQVIGLADNTGKFTTGDHLHFGLKKTFNGNTIETDNGYYGAIDPAPYFKIGSNWDKSAAYHRYGRNRNWLAEYWLRFAPAKENNQWANSGRWIQRQLAKLGLKAPLNGEQVNAIIYGGWNFEAVINPAMYEIWGWVTKNEYDRGVKPFA